MSIDFVGYQLVLTEALVFRMTIGMLVESMAAKAGALRGEFVDATPFKASVQKQDKTVVDQFGEQLAAAGFNYYGNEVRQASTRPPLAFVGMSRASYCGSMGKFLGKAT